MSEHKVNSKAYWDSRFQTNWETFLGREQTTFFIELLIENLPQKFLEEIGIEKYSICDAGCAEGDGTNYLAKKFLNSEIVGIDFSEEAVKKAKEYYPDVNYMQGDIMNLQETFDVILCSNVLEHFSNPFEIIPRLIQSTKRHLIIMVPFLEYERIKEHDFTFEYDSFPLELDGYKLTYFKEIDCRLIEGTHWSGKQAILIYSNNKIQNMNALQLSALNNPSLYYENEYYNLVEKTNIFETKVAEAEQSISWYHKKLEEKEQDVKWYRQKLDEKDELIKQLTSLMETNNEFMSSLKNEVDKSKQEVVKLGELNDYNIQVIHNLNEQLTNMSKTKGWRILNKYYNILNSRKKLKGYVNKFRYIVKTRGLSEAVQRSITYAKNKKTISPIQNDSLKLVNIYSSLVERYKLGEIKGIVVIPSAFEFDEVYNQRTINLAKYLANEGYAIVYVAWQWEKGEILNNNYECYLNKIYQVPLFDFLETQFDCLTEVKDKKIIITFPAEPFYGLFSKLRAMSFDIVYDNMDEWEEFYLTGEAPWYKREIEEAIVLNSDVVFCVSEPLKTKFNFLRQDIVVNGNGYDEKLSKYKNIALKNPATDNKIHLGYFGHMTKSWFDWDLIFKLADQGNVFIHLIGYGADEQILNKIKSFNNIKYYGKVHPSELHNYVREWHIGLIPFKKTKLSVAVDPIKIYEYIYFGLPTVTTGIPHIGSYPLVTHCEGIDDVLSAIDEKYVGVVNGKDLPSDLEDFLIDTQWNMRFNTMLEVINSSNFYQSLFKGE